MSPAARPSIPSSAVIPVPRSALTALNQCRHPLPFETVAKLSVTIIEAAFSAGLFPSSPPAQYIIRRLLAGVSVSSGAVRINYAYILSAVTTELTANANRRAMDEILDAVRRMYGPNGSFEAGYKGAERERALGTLAALAAIAKGCSRRACSVPTFREIVSMLRGIVDADAARWRLRWAVLRILETLLAYAKQENSDTLLKPMWAWCEDRREKEDGLQLALLLHREEFINAKVLAKLYPSLEDGFQTALMDTFETGFPVIEEALFRTDGKKEGGLEYLVPYGWIMAANYVLSEEGAKHLGNISDFWHSVVVRKLLKGSRSGEKKLVALKLIPNFVDGIEDVEIFNSIFDSTLASTVIAILSNRRKKSRGIEFNKGRTSEIAMSRLTESAKQLGEVVVASVFPESGANEDRSPLLRAFLLWAMREGILHYVFTSESLVECMQSMSRNCVILLFSEAVEEFARPRNNGQDSAEFARICNSSQRPNALRFLFILAREHSFLANDVIRIVVLYSFFKEVETTVSEKSTISVKFDVYENRTSDTTFGGLLPLPFPALSAGVAATGFRRLFDFLTESRNEERVGSLSSFSVGLIRSIGASSSTGLISRNFASAARKPMTEDGQTMLAVVSHAVDRLANVVVTSDIAPLVHALKIIVAFTYLSLFEPAQDHEKSVDAEKKAAFYISFLEKVVLCSDALSGEKNASESKITVELAVDEDGGVVIEPIEQTAHLIAELCGMDSAIFRRVALLSTDALGPLLDDKVVAVLFDSIDSYLQGGDETDSSDDEEGHDDFDEIREVGDDGSEVENDSDDEEGSERNGEGSNISKEERNSNDNSRGTAGINDDPRASTEENKDVKTTAKNEDDMDVSDPKDDSESDAGIDIDKEDPAVLAQFDKMLCAHMALLKEEKKEANRRKLKVEFRSIKVSRLLTVIEAVARVLRISIEKRRKEDPKLPLVFMDLHARLYEFALGNEGKNIRFLKQVANIVSKQMLLPYSVLEGKIADAETALEICDRFFQLVKTCNAERRGFPEEMQALSRSAGIFLSIAESLSKEGHARYFSVYKETLEKMLQSGSQFWTPIFFNSFVHIAAEKALDFLSILHSALQSEKMTKSRRDIVSDLILNLAFASRSIETPSNAVDRFWKNLGKLVGNECVEENLARKWHGHGLVNMIQVLVDGIQGEFIVYDEQLISAMTTEVKVFPMNKRERTRAYRLLTSPKLSRKDESKPVSAGERRSESDASSATQSKRRRT